MANEEHLALLKQGVRVWNDWRKNNPEVRPDLSGANLSEANLSGADLREANLSDANLFKTNLIGANLIDANLSKADLCDANLCDANLSKADLSEAILIGANLSGADLSGADLNDADLIEADLRKANLTEAKLSWANLIGANLSDANLSGASLFVTQALDTNFEKAVFTGSYLEDWHINSATRLDGVICDYVYLKDFDEERRPHSGNFAPGEFTKLFQKALETVDLIFSDGIDWEAFLTSYQKLQVECGGEELSIKGIENNDGAFVIRVSVPPDANKVEIEKYLKREYELKLQAIDKKYKYELKAKDEQIKIYRENNTNITEIIKSLPGIFITMQATAVAENKPVSETFNNDLREAKIANFANKVQDNARQQANQYNYAPEQKQTLAEAAAEIQRLLKQLEENNPTATEAEQKAYVTASIPLSVRQRVLSALQAGGKEAMKEFLDNPYLNVAIAVIEDWRETK